MSARRALAIVLATGVAGAVAVTVATLAVLEVLRGFAMLLAAIAGGAA